MALSHNLQTALDSMIDARNHAMRHLPGPLSGDELQDPIRNLSKRLRAMESIEEAIRWIRRLDPEFRARNFPRVAAGRRL